MTFQHRNEIDMTESEAKNYLLAVFEKLSRPATAHMTLTGTSDQLPRHTPSLARINDHWAQRDPR